MDYSIIDASNDFAKLSNSLTLFKKELCEEKNLDFTSQDFRLAHLDTIQQYLLSLTSYIRAFGDLQTRVSQADFLKILNVGISTIEEFENSQIIYKFPIYSLVTMVHFQIDSCFGEICTQKRNSKTGFYNKMQVVLSTVEIDDKKKENYQNTLQCLAFFRNSFHQGGIHSTYKGKWVDGNEPPQGEIDRLFKANSSIIAFKHNETITYNWKSVFLLIKESIKSLEFLIMALDID